MKADINGQLTLEKYIMTKVRKFLLHSVTEIFSHFAKCLSETVISGNA